MSPNKSSIGRGVLGDNMLSRRESFLPILALFVGLPWLVSCGENNGENSVQENRSHSPFSMGTQSDSQRRPTSQVRNLNYYKFTPEEQSTYELEISCPRDRIFNISGLPQNEFISTRYFPTDRNVEGCLAFEITRYNTEKDTQEATKILDQFVEERLRSFGTLNWEFTTMADISQRIVIQKLPVVNSRTGRILYEEQLEKQWSDTIRDAYCNSRGLEIIN